MHVDALVVSAVRAELEQALVGGRIDKIFQPSETSLAVLVRSGGQNHQLLLSAHPQSARLHLVVASRLSSGFEAAPAFVMLLRKYGEGARIETIEQPPHERVIRIALRQPQGGPSRATVLVVEIMGRRSNILLLDQAGTVLGLLKRVTPDMSRERPIKVHDLYRPPPEPTITVGDQTGHIKVSPEDVTPAALLGFAAGTAEKATIVDLLVGGVAGVSPTLAREVAYRATGSTSSRVTVLDNSEIAHATAAQVRALFALETSGSWQPCLAVAAGTPVAFAPYMLEHRRDQAAVQPLSSMSFAVDRYFAARDQHGSVIAQQKRLLGMLKGGISRLSSRVVAYQKEMADARAEEGVRQQGELLIAYQPVTRGVERVQLPDHDGAMVELRVDPLLDATANAQRLFKRYRKARTALSILPDRLLSTEAELAYLQQVATDVELAENRVELAALEADWRESGLFGSSPRAQSKPTSKHPQSKASKGKTSGSKQTPPTPPLSIVVEGYDVIIGRNSRQNEEATFRLANRQDLWFHARNVPGAHVVLRQRGGSPVPDEAIERVASIAAYYSAHRSSTSVTVDVTEVANVRRMRGAKPGMVVYSGERSIQARPARPEGVPPGP